jgi:Fibronectin type III domain
MTRYILINGSTGGPVDIINQPIVEQISTTSVSVNITIVNMASQPTKYKFYWYKLNTSTQVYDLVSSIENPTIPYTITGLVEGASYEFKVEAYSGVTVSQARSAFHVMAGSSINGQVISPTPKTLNAPSKSYMELSVSESEFKANKYAVAYRSFTSVVPPTYSSVNYAGANVSQSVSEANSTAYYSFGGSIFMKNSIENTNAVGGIGFFITPEAARGYYIIIETTASAASFNRKAVRIVKFYGNQLFNLRESGVRTESTIEGIYGGRTYNIDVKVKVSLQSVTINAYINGYKITYTDSTTNNTVKGSTGLIESLQATDRVALLCGRGTVAYDYVYGNTITKTNYEDSAYKINLYQGQFNNDLINTSFGDLIYTDRDDEIDAKGTAIDEFGTVVREIVKSNIKFDTRPAYPVLWSTGANPNAVLLGTKVSSFGAEAYVLNNSSTTIPLQDDLGNALYVYGNSLGSSGTLEYVSNELAEYANPEPVIFESRWLQNLSDVKSLADWIKSKTVVVNRGRVVNLKVFGNPLISVGDIISIKHTYVGLAGTENFIVTNVSQEYSEGLETSITCRSL